MLSLSDQLTNEMPETLTTTQFQASKTARHHLSSNRTFFVSRQKQKHFSFYKYKRQLIYLFRTILFSVYRRRCSAEPPIADAAAAPQGRKSPTPRRKSPTPRRRLPTADRRPPGLCRSVAEPYTPPEQQFVRQVGVTWAIDLHPSQHTSDRCRTRWIDLPSSEVS